MGLECSLPDGVPARCSPLLPRLRLLPTGEEASAQRASTLWDLSTSYLLNSLDRVFKDT